MATKYWIKLYHEILTDPKMGKLPDNLWRRFIECCLMAGELNENGRLPSLPDIAWRLRLDEGTLQTEFDQLARMELIDHRINNVLEDGYWFVVNFGKRQRAMSKAEYMKRLRDKRQKEEYYQPVTNDVTKGNADTDTDKDKDKDKDAPPTPYRTLLDAFINASKLPLLGNLKPRDNEALLFMVENECVPADVEAAVAYSTQNDLPIVGVASVKKGTMVARGQRLREVENPKEDKYAAKGYK